MCECMHGWHLFKTQHTWVGLSNPEYLIYNPGSWNFYTLYFKEGVEESLRWISPRDHTVAKKSAMKYIGKNLKQNIKEG